MSSSARSKAVTRVILASGLIVVLMLLAFGAQDQSLAGLVVVFAVVLGIPFLLLSLIDLGRALRADAGGDFRATKATWLLTHLQAAFGAVCMAAAAFAVYQNLASWFGGTTDSHWVLVLAYVILGLGMVLVGFRFIYSAFVPDSSSRYRGNDA